MKFNPKLLLLSVSSLCLEARAANILPASGVEVIPNSYLIIMKDEISQQQFDTHLGWAAHIHQRDIAAERPNFHADLRQPWNIGGLRGYSGTFSEDTITKIAESPDVAYIEHDLVVRPLGAVVTGKETQTGAPWHLARVSHKTLPKEYTYIYNKRAGKDVNIYIADTGVDGSNSGLKGRVRYGINTSGDSSDVDGHGHGTAVTEVMAGTHYGVAKKATVVSVKVLDARGNGATSGILEGFEWVLKDAKERNILGKAILNLSIGGGYSEAFNKATENVVKAGIFVSVTVGAENRDAKNSSPASAEGVCAVASTTDKDEHTSFTSFGPIVDLNAPGALIQTKSFGDKNVSMSGGSFSAGLLSGMAAYAIDAGTKTDGVCDLLKKIALPVIKAKPNTTNLLLFNLEGEL